MREMLVEKMHKEVEKSLNEARQEIQERDQLLAKAEEGRKEREQEVEQVKMRQVLGEKMSKEVEKALGEAR